jgi:hypothetical protein
MEALVCVVHEYVINLGTGGVLADWEQEGIRPLLRRMLVSETVRPAWRFR